MSRKPKRYHYIYKTTCKVTGKFYVGMHSSDSLDDGYLGSGKILGYSRRKYGDENHVREILEFCSSRDELKQREKEIVNEALLADPLNINLKYGGEGGGKIWNEAHRIKFLEAASKSNGWKRLKRLSPDELSKRGTNSAKTRKLNGANHKTKHSEKTKQKISNSMCGKQTGEKNSQFGSCWVNNGINSIKIKKEQLDEFAQSGYLRGRILSAK